MSQITYDNKVTLVSQPDVANENKVTASDMNEIKTAHNDTDTKLGNIGKLLWSGNFTSGSITVDGLSNYSVCVFEAGSVLMFGNTNRGLGGIGTYGTYGNQVFSYRFAQTGDTLTINATDVGVSNGSSNVALTKIYGLF